MLERSTAKISGNSAHFVQVVHPRAKTSAHRDDARRITAHRDPAIAGDARTFTAPAAAGNPGPPGKNGDDGRTGLVTKTRPKTKKPSLYKVLLLNDDYTPMEFVVHVLQKYFSKNREEAERIMLHVHQKGVGICGVYTFEIAETKVTQVMDFSRANNHPLQCTMEKE
jgi:ATP-dependent Clp protease adaptor protein ClpS